MLQISGDNYPQNEYRIFADFTPVFRTFYRRFLFAVFCKQLIIRQLLYLLKYSNKVL